MTVGTLSYTHTLELALSLLKACDLFAKLADKRVVSNLLPPKANVAVVKVKVLLSGDVLMQTQAIVVEPRVCMCSCGLCCAGHCITLSISLRYVLAI